MTQPEESPEPLPSVDDPGFADDILARARQRAESTAPGVPPATEPGTEAPAAAITTVPAPEPPPRPEAPAAATAVERGPAAGADDADGRGPAGEDDPSADESEDRPASRTRSLVEWLAVAVGALVVAFLIRSFLLQAFYIPSESMEPTLKTHDRILVNKLSYKFHDVHRGDVVVFKRPPAETDSTINDLIKRVVALPGETIEQRGSQIFIDNRLLTEPYLPAGLDPGPTITWVKGCTNPQTETARCTIPSGDIWVMGDNRPHSHDSRFFGPISEHLIVGRAFVKVWPLNKIGFM